MAKEFSFSDESLVTKIVPKFRFLEGEKSVKKRILFISNKLIKETVHVIENNGFLKCLAEEGGDCPACAAGNFKKARYATHVLEYATDPNGKPMNPFSASVKAFAFAKGTAEKLKNLNENMGENFQKLDVVVACENPTYQLINFTPDVSGKGSFYSQQPDAFRTGFREEIKKQVADIDLSEVIARIVSPETMADMLSGKIKTFTPKTAPATAAPAGTTAASAAAPLTAAPATASVVVLTPTAEVSAAQEGASKMMEDLAI